MLYNIKRFFRRIYNFFYYGYKFNNVIDYDSQDFYYFTYIKLSKLYECMLNNSHLQWNSDKDNTGMRKLREAIHLAKYLYDEHHYDESYDKYYQVDLLHYNYLSLENLNRDTKEKRALIRSHKKLDRKIALHKKRFYYLLQKYLDTWWD